MSKISEEDKKNVEKMKSTIQYISDLLGVKIFKYNNNDSSIINDEYHQSAETSLSSSFVSKKTEEKVDNDIKNELIDDDEDDKDIDDELGKNNVKYKSNQIIEEEKGSGVNKSHKLK